MNTYTVESFNTRGSTCQSIRYRILKNGKRTSTEFGSFNDAKRIALARNLEETISAAGFVFDNYDKELANMLIPVN